MKKLRRKLSTNYTRIAASLLIMLLAFCVLPVTIRHESTIATAACQLSDVTSGIAASCMPEVTDATEQAKPLVSVFFDDQALLGQTAGADFFRNIVLSLGAAGLFFALFPRISQRTPRRLRSRTSKKASSA